ncbi:hypothetical protein MUCCIDRAFT_107097 [Mucor lusitanicus CBS 277.49]|uniref:Uncharacterized protein n=1 Tax=Mucor lusitanicus CBS 277.49 TaxID=747725 RepID=A0A168NNG2_MUCCL|nr:hypothetical protein MUCCIDRAFT_107097 [Mucor lusitanicus CBS 277.49]
MTYLAVVSRHHSDVIVQSSSGSDQQQSDPAPPHASMTESGTPSLRYRADSCFCVLIPRHSKRPLPCVHADEAELVIK